MKPSACRRAFRALGSSAVVWLGVPSGRLARGTVMSHPVASLAVLQCISSIRSCKLIFKSWAQGLSRHPGNQRSRHNAFALNHKQVGPTRNYKTLFSTHAS